jgi:hypothetical protein
MDEKPKIFVFSNVVGGGEGICLAVAEDGTVLGSHFCSDEGHAAYDLGAVKGSSPDRHRIYEKHYPDGYDMEFVPNKFVKTHSGIREAYAKNRLKVAGEVV